MGEQERVVNKNRMERFLIWNLPNIFFFLIFVAAVMMLASQIYVKDEAYRHEVDVMAISDVKDIKQKQDNTSGRHDDNNGTINIPFC